MGDACFMDKEEDCRTSRSVYCIQCQICAKQNPPKKSLYYGTTGRCTHSRFVEHQKALQNRTRNSALSKHQEATHPNTQPEFQGSIVKGGIRFNVERFILESIKISEANDDSNVNLLNQKGEWGDRGIPRLRVDQ